MVGENKNEGLMRLNPLTAVSIKCIMMRPESAND